MSEHVADRLAAYLHHELSAEERRGVQAHLQACGSCVDQMASLRDAHALLENAPLLTAPDAVWDRIEAELNPEASRPRRRLSLSPRWLAAGAVAAAAAVLLLLLPRDDGGAVALDPYISTVEAAISQPNALDAIEGGFKSASLDEAFRAVGMTDAQRTSPSPEFTLQRARTQGVADEDVVQLVFAGASGGFSVFIASSATELDFGDRTTQRVKMGTWECTQVASETLAVYWAVWQNRQSVLVAAADQELDVARILSFFVYGKWNESS